MGNYNHHFVGIKGGCDETYWEIVAQEETQFEDFPAYGDDGNIIDYTQAVSLDDYMSRKRSRVRPAIVLTVMGNPVSCAEYLKESGYDAHNIAPYTVYLIINN